ncbi:UDP-N-acetylmuramoyl-tripeptide--D-alanyl-D-alanine ligase [Paraburkholderia sp. MMS20-SJTN17]|uniref:UDP-N-acetylmuramoyl-tripeptide--D-alanyl-D-alanine ligase n=1 Tax=Paraburkholderia translucens TaxID=2886945 RepID=A0ABS8KMJ9_9BURK|nr:UDP-N-acetylmuramoyl-tripeptide--D-alanyl-D-alanine ligase [Paraburkholderia sp. MMS20-SJTN17]MCC8405629.1 UDP-N-acetylmuramoyl-tripeptide--D-alanyl-D-alanine ligase [Paraburkholderia sp. MMS20-SJTN17]
MLPTAFTSTDSPALFARLRSAVEPQVDRLAAPWPSFVLFFSWSDGQRRADVVSTTAPTFDEAWTLGMERAAQAVGTTGVTVQWLRVDWVENVEGTTWRALRERLEQTKRNYFRSGLSLDSSFTHAFLETELNANAMLYGGAAHAHAVVNMKNFERYAANRHKLANVDFADARDVYVFSSRGAFTSRQSQEVHLLHGTGPNAGRRVMEHLEPADVRELVASGSRYLAGQVQQDGRFHYGWHPCFDRAIGTYNTLRHASSVYAMLEAWEVTRDSDLKIAIDAALHYLVNELIMPVKLPSGARAAFLVDAKAEIKLGGNGVCLLALVKYSELTGSREYMDLLEQLATGILFMQDADTGKFSHVLNYPDLSVKQAFRIIYYDGEAAFGLMRLYGLTNDARWLAAVEKAFGFFIEANHWKAHDHWLSYCVNELTRHRPLEAYYKFGIQNFAGYLDFVIGRITTFPTLLELMTAAEQMIGRLRQQPELEHLLAGVDLDKFFQALHARAQRLLNGYFWPELAMYFANPGRITGSFFIRHHAFRIRIDDVEHYLSGFVAYLNYLNKQQQPASSAAGREWNASVIRSVTQGTWLTAPSPGWTASGLCIYAPAMQAGNVVVARVREADRGIPVSVIRQMLTRPVGVIASDPDVQAQLKDLPVLHVADTGEAILAMGTYARQQMSGTVLAVTGSAGKTTLVAMLADTLNAYGQTAASAFNANLPHGLSWNLASITWDTPHVVLEVAVGNMKKSALIARPDISIFTNIQPAHLGKSSTITDIARTKSMIFLGMSAGSTVILNRDMLEWDTVFHAAMERDLKIVTYGTTAECDLQLVRHDAAQQSATVRIRGRDVTYAIGAAGLHMALNSVAVLAAVLALNYPLEPALDRIANFAALSGRGEELELTLDGRHLTVVDHAYNANPGSMRAALEHLRDMKSAGRRVAVLGEMAELGPEAPLRHTELAAVIERCAIDRVYVMGKLYTDFWERLPNACRGRHTHSLDELKSALHEELADEDVVLLKGSNSTGIHHIVTWMKASAQKQAV